ncbi:MAG: hypothetical protein Q9222_004343 [Ikaeria aurantiellina]
MEEDPSLIAILIPVDAQRLAESASYLEHNEAYQLPPSTALDRLPNISSRETTPALEHSDYDKSEDYTNLQRLKLTFGEKPKDPGRGYSFGTYATACNILLGSRGLHGISRVHFYITFGLNTDGERLLILRDRSSNGMAVSYNGQAKEELRRDFTWILNLKNERRKWDVEIHVCGMSFKVQLASHKTCQVEYNEKMDGFLAESRTAFPQLDVLGIDNPTPIAQPSRPLTPRQLPIYLRLRELGEGSFGVVHKVVDASTGTIYARKTFRPPRREDNKVRMKHRRMEWSEQIRREARIMVENVHENIIGVHEFRDGPRPFLIMPYLSCGNLADLSAEDSITDEDCPYILFQALDALSYLHSRSVAHRDLKPENILVETRHPLQIKLADFGLANDKETLKTLCGSPLYLAPEVDLETAYSPLVDVWSLGVIILQYAYELPEVSSRWIIANGRVWCQSIVNRVNDSDWDGGPLRDLLTSGMLHMEPEERLSAADCITTGLDLGVFDFESLDARSATPTQQVAAQSDVSDDEESFASEQGSHHTSMSQTRCGPPSGSPKSFGSCSLESFNPEGNWVSRAQHLEGFDSNVDHSANTTKAPTTTIKNILEAGRADTASRKRQRSPLLGSLSFLSSEGQSKRRTEASTSDLTDSQWSSSLASEKPETYPSELLDETNLSGCSIPATAGRPRHGTPRPAR